MRRLVTHVNPNCHLFLSPSFCQQVHSLVVGEYIPQGSDQAVTSFGRLDEIDCVERNHA